ncbi:putative acetyltransferase [Rivularia sp. PCC 7116]|uniref:GNAT family N-acetyltransferase n=1 Tax=Rivularia sp. PCC 7116 TaxID=373994 RepID=UPI00029EE977|nr:GNAT family N-acetyltransferase [Rivularia sp. PCC 7116]AFY55675.1 putative acetyltransferase [Rivularia sp. PCC 7116]
MVNVMKSEFVYSNNCNWEDARQFGSILGQCFLSSPDEEESWIELMEIENLRVIHRNKEVIGGLAVVPMAQWWGAKSVEMTGIAGVGIAAEYRGTGAALSLMQQTLKELYIKGIAISVLYPTTQRLYRKLGYEQGGSFYGWEASAQSIQIREQPLPMKAVPTDSQIFYELYEKQAKNINGHLNRAKPIWHRIMTPDKGSIYAYLIGSAEEPEGYIIFSQHPAEDGAILRVRDWVVLTNAAAQTFWSFLNNHRSQIDKIRWRSSVIDHLALLLPEQTAKIKFMQCWMLRIINVEKALSTRGYSSGIETELHLEITDDLIPENNGKFILSVAKGSGKIAKGGKGELKLDIRGLASLYAGLFSPQQLKLAGKLDGTENSLANATQIFSGTSPWMMDFF